MDNVISIETSSRKRSFFSGAEPGAATSAFARLAHQYASDGFQVFPAHTAVPKPGSGLECSCMAWKRKQAATYGEEPAACDAPAKHGRVDSWQRRATSDAKIIDAWLSDSRNRTSANIGIATGRRSGFWTLDIDGEEGERELAALEAEHGPLPVTPTIRTGSGGLHYWFRYPVDREIRNSASKVAPKIDVRGDDGYVIAPPSRHISGNFYQFEDGKTPSTVGIADAPEWLLALVCAPKTEKPRAAKPAAPAARGASAGDGKGFEYHLSTIGDGEGQGGFDGPINSAALAWFAQMGVEADTAPLKAMLLETVEAATKDPAKPRGRYSTDAYLDERIEKSRAFIAAEQAKAERYIFDDTADLMEAMNKKVAMIYGTKKNSYVLFPDGDFIMKPKDDTADYLAPYKFRVEKEVKDKISIEFVSAFGVWRNHPDHRQHRYPIFEPGLTSTTDFNTWRGFALQPAEGGWSKLDWHIRHIICSGNEDHYKWLMAWTANIFQYPRNKPGTAIVLRGDQGIGKSTLADTLCTIIGRNHSGTLSNRDDLTGRFNEHFAEKLFMSLEEAYWAGDHRAEGILKQLITGPRIMVEPKFVSKYEVSNHLRLMLIGNKDWLVPAGKNERRYFVLDVSDEKMKHETYFEELYTEIENGGAAAFLHALLEWDCSGVNLRQPPETDAFKDQQAESLSAPEEWWRGILVDGGFEGAIEDIDGRRMPMSEDWPKTGKLTVRRDLVFDCWRRAMPKDYMRTPERMGKFLRKMIGGKITERKIDGKRGYELPSLADLRAKYEAEHRYKFERSEQG